MSERKEKFTPGPWKVGISCKDSDPSGPGEVTVVPGDHPIGKYEGKYVFSIAKCGPEGDPTTIADARLISAAPELYAICDEIREAFAYFSEWDLPIGFEVRLDAALAKARGES